jgi:hypothetical protein
MGVARDNGDEDMLEGLQNILLDANVLIREIKTIRDWPPEEIEHCHLVIDQTGQVNKRYNAPTAAEIAGFQPGEGAAANEGGPHRPREIVFHTRVWPPLLTAQSPSPCMMQARAVV